MGSFVNTAITAGCTVLVAVIGLLAKSKLDTIHVLVNGRLTQALNLVDSLHRAAVAPHVVTNADHVPARSTLAIDTPPPKGPLDMTDCYDAVNPNNLPAFLDGAPALRITVLASPDGEAFDVEQGNAGPTPVAGACHDRYVKGLWSMVYTNEDGHQAVTDALAVLGLGWTPAVEWPKPGVYLWAADWDIPTGQVPSWCPVAPLMVQNRHPGPFDVSWVNGAITCRVAGYIDGAESTWPAAAWSRFAAIGSPHPASQPERCNVQLAILGNGSTGQAVASVQTLLGHLSVDGIFGPLTEARTKEYQAGRGLAQDGIVGQHTWGQLLGCPQ